MFNEKLNESWRTHVCPYIPAFACALDLDADCIICDDPTCGCGAPGFMCECNWSEEWEEQMENAMIDEAYRMFPCLPDQKA